MHRTIESSSLHDQAALEAAVAALVAADPRLRPVVERAGMPALRRRAPGYAGLAAIVVGQQLSVASAAAIQARLEVAVRPFEPAVLLRTDPAILAAAGLSRGKVRALTSLAAATGPGGLDLGSLAGVTAAHAHGALIALHGVGPWTADVYLLFCLGHGDAWPAGDLALQEAMRHGLDLPQRPGARDATVLAAPWRPWRGAAAHLWWAYYRTLRAGSGAPGG